MSIKDLFKKTDSKKRFVIDRIAKDVKSVGKEAKGIKFPTLPKGTPPADMNPVTQTKWWDICRSEEAPGIDHPGIYPGCFECYTMCASHPAGDVGGCITNAINNCLIPEINDEIQRLLFLINPPDTCTPWTPFDSNTWESELCLGPIECSNECARFCPDEGFNTGQCETVGDLFYCNCS